MTGARGAAERALAVLLGWLLTVLATSALAQGALVDITSPVTDRASVLSSVAEQELSGKLAGHRDRTGVQMAVVTVATTAGEPIEDYSMRLATAWGGGTKERDDGVLLLLAIHDRTMRLEVGYGIEPAIPDSAAKAILDGGRDHLRSGDYDAAITSMVDRVIARTAHVVPGRRASSYSEPLGAHAPIFYPLVLLGGLIAGWFLGRTLGKGGSDEEGSPSTAAVHVSRWAWLALLVVVVGLGWQGRYHVAYAIVLGAGVLLGVACQRSVEDYLSWVICFLISLGGLYFFGLASYANRFFGPGDVLHTLLVHLAASCAGMVALKVSQLTGSGRGGSSTYGSSSWSSGSSSWSSGSSWSGGGGSFGGGGASSSW